MPSVYLMALMAVTAQAFPGTAEVQVNDRTSEAQANAAAASSTNGSSVIVWSSYYTSSGRSNDIFARRLDAAGGFAGGEFLVNVTTQGNQTEPAVAMDSLGRFAVVWQGPGVEQEDIFLRLFWPNGSAATQELPVNLDTAGRQLYPSVAAAGTGTLAVAWESRETTAQGQRVVVLVQRFDPNGSRLGGPVPVDTEVYDCRYPEVAMDGTGRFAVTWMRDRTSHPIVARLFDAAGVPLMDPREVNTTGISSVTRPSIAMNARGYFVVAWDGHPARAGEDDVYARRYDPNGVPRGEPFIVNTIRAGVQQLPQAAINDANEFIVVWEHDTGDPNAATEIAARYFGRDGMPISEQFQLNTYTPEAQRYPDVAMAGAGFFLAAWESDGQDGSDYGIFGGLEPAPLPADPNQSDAGAQLLP
ncbi:MAG: hypothetical protein M1376_13125 [Planctomycetes bacterium]|nr:hypothetical protein [Planctomycetota bacterium]